MHTYVDQVQARDLATSVKYIMRALMNEGISREEAFEFVISYYKGAGA